MLNTLDLDLLAALKCQFWRYWFPDIFDKKIKTSFKLLNKLVSKEETNTEKLKLPKTI